MNTAMQPIPVHLVMKNTLTKQKSPLELAIDGMPEPILTQESRRTPNQRQAFISVSNSRENSLELQRTHEQLAKARG